MSEVKHTSLKSFWGKKLEGEHGVWFGGEWEEREWFVWLISLIWQDKGIKEAVLGKMWADPWEALPSGAWSTGEPRSTACDKGVGECCQLRIWADCPRTTPQKLPETGFSKKLIVCVFTLSEHYDTIYIYIGRQSFSIEFKKSPSCGAQASRSRLRVTRRWASAVGWKFELTAQGPLHKNSLAWSTGEPRSTACDKGMGKRCPLRIWADCPRTAPQKLPRVEHRWASVNCVWQGDGRALPAENLSFYS